MKTFGLVAVVLLVLAAGDFLLYVSEDGMECQGGNCSSLADLTGALLVPLIILAILVLLAGLVRGRMGRGKRA